MPRPPSAPEVLAVTLGGLNIAEFAEKSVVKAMEFLHTLKLTEMQHKSDDRVIKEIMDRLGFCSRSAWNI